jgi:hypothetical protein
MRIYIPNNLLPICLWLGLASVCIARNPLATQTPDLQKPADQAASPPTSSPLPTPSITGSLKAAPPNTFDGGPSDLLLGVHAMEGYN